MACKYVKDFEFPTEAGFTASAGKTMVKGYARGGPLNKQQGGIMTATGVPAATTTAAPVQTAAPAPTDMRQRLDAVRPQIDARQAAVKAKVSGIRDQIDARREQMMARRDQIMADHAARRDARRAGREERREERKDMIDARRAARPPAATATPALSNAATGLAKGGKVKKAAGGALGTASRAAKGFGALGAAEAAKARAAPPAKHKKWADGPERVNLDALPAEVRAALAAEARRLKRSVPATSRQPMIAPQPVKKGMGGILKAMSPVAMMMDGGMNEKALRLLVGPLGALLLGAGKKKDKAGAAAPTAPGAVPGSIAASAPQDPLARRRGGPVKRK